MSLAFYIGIETESGRATHPHFDPEEAVTVFTFIEALMEGPMPQYPDKSHIRAYFDAIEKHRDTIRNDVDWLLLDAYWNRLDGLISLKEEYQRDGQNVFIYIA